jgi:trehalose/maltose transport system substrate-binding protein
VAVTLGGSGLAVSRYSAHQEEAIELVRYLTEAEIGAMKAKERDIYHRQPDDPQLPQSKSEIVLRPSSVAGQAYEQISKAYISAVHSVLTGKEGAAHAAAELERQLITKTGFSTGPPQ